MWIGSFSSSSRSALGFWSNSSTNPFGIEAMKCSEAASSTAPAKECGATNEVVSRGQGGDAAAFRETAGPGEVRLHDVDGAARDQLAKAVEPDLGLIAGDRRRERRCDPGAAVDVVGRDRFLDP